MLEDIHINVVLDGEDFAIRIWPVVPRTGEIISLNSGLIKARVDNVLWGNSTASEKSYPRGRLLATIFCTSLPEME
ncbi:MAG: hypothetical protein ACE14T_10150 [Syntrophales bacterium]